MRSKVFYEGMLMGEFDSPIGVSTAYFCTLCGRIFARRVCNIVAGGLNGWRTDEGFCAPCASRRVGYHPGNIVIFRGGIELLDFNLRLPALDAAQLLYEIETAIGRPNEYISEPLGFSGPEHEFRPRTEDPLDGR